MGPSPGMSRCRPYFGRAASPVDLHSSRIGIDQPARLCAVLDVFAHFGAQGGQPVRWGAQIDHKGGTEVPVSVAAFAGELAISLLGVQDASGERRAPLGSRYPVVEKLGGKTMISPVAVVSKDGLGYSAQKSANSPVCHARRGQDRGQEASSIANGMVTS